MIVTEASRGHGVETPCFGAKLHFTESIMLYDQMTLEDTRAFDYDLNHGWMVSFEKPVQKVQAGRVEPWQLS